MIKKVVKTDDVQFVNPSVKETFDNLATDFIDDTGKKKLIRYVYNVGFKIVKAKIGESRSEGNRRSIFLIYAENLNKDSIMLKVEKNGTDLFQLRKCINKGWQKVVGW